MNIYKFSYDSKQDALNSLANYYQISVDILRSKLSDIFNYMNNLDTQGFYQEYMDNGMMLLHIRYLLNPDLNEIQDSIVRISFYHRCTSNGKYDWFCKGILNSFDGIDEFINQINKLFPESISNEQKSIIKRLLQIRHNDEYFNCNQVKYSGAYGFYRLEDATNTLDCNYDFPEIIQNFLKEDGHLKKELEKVLKISVVKVYVERKLDEIDRILSIYWTLLFGENNGIYSTTTSDDFGRGKTIPFENIQHIYYLD